MNKMTDRAPSLLIVDDIAAHLTRVVGAAA